MTHEHQLSREELLQILWDTQHYLTEVLAENEALRRAKAGLEGDADRLREEKRQLERQLVVLLKRLAGPVPSPPMAAA